MIGRGERDSRTAVAAARGELAAHDLEAEYLEIVDPDTLEPVKRVERPVLVALAARVGRARLIDNVIATPSTNGAEPS